MNNKTSMGKRIAIIALVVVLALSALYPAISSILSGPDGEKVDQTKEIALEIKVDGETKEKVYQTNYVYLGDLLNQTKLCKFEDSEYGRFLTSVDGTAADTEKQTWWFIAVNGEAIQEGVDKIQINDQDKVTLELKQGYTQ